MVQIGEKFSKQLELNETEISHFARMCGDPNPLHHDLEYAKNTRFGKIIVSGPHISSLMMATIAEHFSYTAVVGLEFSFQFLKAIAARELVNLEWEVISSQNKPSLNGEIVELKGKITNENQEILLSGRGKILVADRL
jgi:3-hydroxybutyryl-CoA dehydratase